MSTTTEKPIYVRNPKGGVHSVSEDHYKSLLEEDGTLPKNWAKVSEADAKKANPGLFGLGDDGQPVNPAPVQPVTADELAAALIRAATPASK